MLNVVHIQDDFLFSFRDQVFQFVAQSTAFIAKHDATVQGDHRCTIHFSAGHLQYHVGSLLECSDNYGTAAIHWISTWAENPKLKGSRKREVNLGNLIRGWRRFICII